MSHKGTIFNDELIAIAKDRLRKRAFVDAQSASGGGGDPSAAGGMPPGMDPSQGGMPPGMDPSQGGMPPGMDPSQGGAGGPPPSPGGTDPSAGGGGAGGPDLQTMINNAVAQALQAQGGPAGAGGAGGAGGAAGGLKPKIDVNVEIMQIKNMLAKIIDGLGIPVQAQDFTATQDKLNQMAANPGSDASGQAGGAGAGAGPASAIQPPQPIQPAMPQAGGGGGGGGHHHKQGNFNPLQHEGEAFDSTAWDSMTQKSSALATILRRKACESKP